MDYRYIFTGGGDGTVLRFPTDKPLSLETMEKHRGHRGGITCLDVVKDKIATCATDGQIIVYPTDKLVDAQLVYRDTLPLQAVALHPNAKYVAFAGDFGAVRVVALDAIENGPIEGTYHNKSVTSIAYDPKGEYLASVDRVGGVCIWEAKSLKVVHTFQVHVPEKYAPLVSWSPDGKLLAVTGGESVECFVRSKWSLEKKFSTGTCHKQTNVLVWSRDGSLLLTADMSKVAAWNVKKEALISSVICQDFSILCADLSTDKKELSFIDNNGNLIKQSTFLSDQDLPSTKPLSSDVDSIAKKYLAMSTNDDEFSDEEDEKGIDLNDTSGGEEEEKEDEYNRDFLDDADLDDYDPHMDQSLDKTFKDKPEIVISTPSRKHLPFMPCSTDPISDHRFLAWNMVGIITSRLDEAGYRSVDIEFHDKLTYRPIRFIDDYGFKMAALSKNCAFFATQYDPDTNLGCTLHYMAFETWTGKQTWTLQLEEDEHVLSIACNDQYAFAVTSYGWLRAFSSTGIQLPILTLNHDIVTMVADDTKLLLILDNNGSLLAQLYTLAPSHPPVLSFEGSLGRRADRNGLTWAGFSTSGIAGCFDRTGVLYALCDKLGFTWTPIGDFSTQHTAGEVVWPISFDRSIITCIVCRGGQNQPAVLPRPIMSDLPLRIPLIQSSEDAASYEPVLLHIVFDQLVSGSIGLKEKEQRKLNTASDKHVLELIQLAIKAEKPLRAVELCGLFYNEKSFDLAIQLARYHRMVTLADKIDLTKDQFMARQSKVEVHAATPRLPVRIQHESPSTILANLTPDAKPSLRAETSEMVPESPSMNKTLKRTRMDLVADSEVVVHEEVDVEQEGPVDVERVHEPLVIESVVKENVANTTPSKPKGLVDMLSKLSSLATEVTAVEQVPPPKKSAKIQKENIPEPVPQLSKGLKQSSLPTMFKKSSDTSNDAQ